LLLISQGVAGVGRDDFAARVALVSLGTLGIILVLLRSLDEQLAMERRLAQRSLTDERRRLASDVHDVVGHTLSASMLHTTAARLSIRSDPDAAIASLERAERHGRRSMDDIRSVVRLLRDDGDGRLPAPLSGDIPAMVEEFRAAGAPIDGTVGSELDDLPATTALTAYRVVQEGLTNAIRHGTGAIDLTVDTPGEGDHVEIRIGNDIAGAASPTGGSGLPGMRERVTAAGGTLVAGPADSHRWLLSVRLPR
jgi:signal transduction histidine kinase